MSAIVLLSEWYVVTRRYGVRCHTRTLLVQFSNCTKMSVKKYSTRARLHLKDRLSRQPVVPIADSEDDSLFLTCGALEMCSKALTLLSVMILSRNKAKDDDHLTSQNVCKPQYLFDIILPGILVLCGGWDVCVRIDVCVLMTSD